MTKWPTVSAGRRRQGPAHRVICGRKDGKVDAGELDLV